MKLSRATSLILVFWLVGCQTSTLTYTTHRAVDDFESRYPFLDRPFPVVGSVPLFEVLQELEAKELVLYHPAQGAVLTTSYQAQGVVRVRDLIAAIETAEGWTFDPATKRFEVAVATHPMDQPDAFGRRGPGVAGVERTARGSVSVEFRFRSVNLGASIGSGSGLNGSATLEEFAGSIPEGVQAQWSSTEERSYFEGIESPQGVSGVVVNTQRQTVEAGLEFSALAARLPGQNFRVTGSLQISTFDGTGLDRNVISLPVQADAKLNTWVRLVRIRGADATAQAVWKHFNGNVGLTADAIDLEIRVE